MAAANDVQIGVDVEATAAANFHRTAAVFLHPGENPGNEHERARLWTAKEALLKAHGTGLATDPRTVRISHRPGSREIETPESADPSEELTVVDGPPALVVPLAAPRGLVATLAVRTAQPVRVHVHAAFTRLT